MAINLNQVTPRQHANTAVVLFASEAELVRAVRELHRLGYANDQVSVLAKDRDRLAECIRLEGANEAVNIDVARDLAFDSEPKGRPEFMGMTIGGVLGVLIGLSAVALPGFGAFLLASGPLAISIHGLTVGAAGMGLGALLGAILDEKVTEDHRDYYERELASGKWMLVVHGNETEIERAEEALGTLGVARIDHF